jgi:hypothetical protein
MGQSPCLCQENSDPKIALLDSHLYRKPSLLITIADNRKSQRQITQRFAAGNRRRRGRLSFWSPRTE